LPQTIYITRIIMQLQATRTAAQLVVFSRQLTSELHHTDLWQKVGWTQTCCAL